ncbi:MAG: SusC/RagA family TonB-linked outer membrane protein, partial [Bacteroidales bacterium]|nr:SusC/RagA family TonB-linked outer membrane protein [Bacteroidales bacterium]
MEQKINLNDGVYKKCSNMLCVLRIAFLFTMLFPLDILAGNVYSQPKEVSVNLKNVTIRQAISEIEKRSEYLFLITEDAEKYLNRNVNLSAENESINIILDKLLQNTSVKYQVVERQVLVYAGNEKPDTGSIVTGQQKPVRITVKGTVTDNKNRPLAGVAIRVKGTNRGVASDDNGNYEIPDVLPEDILEVTCIGMKSEFYSVRNRTMVNIVMQEDAAFLEEMVVTGYQTIPKERSTGAYSILSSDKLRQKPTANISNILNGLVPGLTVENSSVDGANRFTIRGKGSLRGYQSDSDPLIVLDGFPISNNTETNDPFETINPNDVESITVLKDAAATSIYGACAANGVIVITTKKGKSNKLDISTDAYWSVSSRVDLDYLFNMASAENQFRYVELMHGYNALPLANDPYSDPRNHLTYMSEPRRLLFERDMKGNITADQYNNFKNELIELGNKGVWKDDLNDYIFRKMLRSQYNVALRGKSDVMSYSFSGLYDDEKGFLKGNDKQRVILNINTSSKLTNNLTFDVGLSSSFTKQQNRGSSIYSNLSGIVTPWTRLVGENSEYLHVPTHSTVYESILESECQGKTPADWHYNPIKDRQYIDNSAKTMNYRIHGGFGYSTIWGLNLSAKGQYEWGRSTSHLAYDPESYFVRNYYNTYSTLNASTGMFESYFPNGGIFTDNENVYEAYTIRGQADYNYSKDKHAFSLLAGTEVLSSTTNFTPSITRYGYNKYTNAVQVQPDYISDVVTIFNRVSDAKTKMPYNDLGTLTTYEDRFFSVYANISYTYNDRYSLTGSFRTDASNFQSKKQRDKFSPFWSLGGSWLISRESFMEQVSWVDMLKLRASWGIAGIAAGKRKISSVTTISTRPGNILFNKGESFNDISYPGNETLTWEKSRTVNVGLDMALFNH